MRTKSFRILAALVFFLVAVMISGLPAAVSAAVSAQAGNSCCDRDESGGGAETVPCSAPECPCLSCLAFDTVEPFSFRVTSFEIPSPQILTTSLHPKLFAESIDYPPETA